MQFADHLIGLIQLVVATDNGSRFRHPLAQFLMDQVGILTSRGLEQILMTRFLAATARSNKLLGKSAAADFCD